MAAWLTPESAIPGHAASEIDFPKTHADRPISWDGLSGPHVGAPTGPKGDTQSSSPHLRPDRHPGALHMLPGPGRGSGPKAVEAFPGRRKWRGVLGCQSPTWLGSYLSFAWHVVRGYVTLGESLQLSLPTSARNPCPIHSRSLNAHPEQVPKVTQASL